MSSARQSSRPGTSRGPCRSEWPEGPPGQRRLPARGKAASRGPRFRGLGRRHRRSSSSLRTHGRSLPAGRRPQRPAPRVGHGASRACGSLLAPEPIAILLKLRDRPREERRPGLQPPPEPERADQRHEQEDECGDSDRREPVGVATESTAKSTARNTPAWKQHRTQRVTISIRARLKRSSVMSRERISRRVWSRPKALLMSRRIEPIKPRTRGASGSVLIAGR